MAKVKGDVGQVKFDDGGSIINMTVHLDKIGEHVYEYEGKKYVNLTIGANKGGANEYGKTHYVAIDTFKPDAKEESKDDSKGGDELPF